MLSFAPVIGKPYEGKLHVRFDEGALETEHGGTRRHLAIERAGNRPCPPKPPRQCSTLQLRNLKKYAPERYHKQIHWRMKKMMGLVDYNEALKELVSFTQWLSEISHEAHSSMEEVGNELLTLHKLGLTKELRMSLSSTNLIESLFGVIRLKTNRVNNWKKDKTQITRWVASAIKAHAPKMRKLSGSKHAHILLDALGRKVDQERKLA